MTTLRISRALSGRSTNPCLVGWDENTKTSWGPTGWMCDCDDFQNGDDDTLCAHVDELEAMVIPSFFEIRPAEPKSAPKPARRRRTRPSPVEAGPR